MKKLFQQLFSFVNVQLFNQLLLRRECCSFTNGEYVKTGLAEVETWIHGAGKEWVGDSWEELKFIRQAVTFLVRLWPPSRRQHLTQSCEVPSKFLCCFPQQKFGEFGCSVHLCSVCLVSSEKSDQGQSIRLAFTLAALVSGMCMISTLGRSADRINLIRWWSKCGGGVRCR